MAQSFPEKAHLKTDLKKYADNWEHIFKKKCDCHLKEFQVCDICQGITGQEKDLVDKDQASK